MGRFRQEHPQTQEIYDAKHKAACLLKKRLADDEPWKRSEAQVAQTRCAVQQTDLAYLMPPAGKTKARFMNLQPHVDWGAQALALLQHSDRGRGRGPGGRGCGRNWGGWRSLPRHCRSGNCGSRWWSWRWGGWRANGCTPAPARTCRRNWRTQQWLPGSTTMLESVLGQFKVLEKQRAQGGFTGLVLGMGAMVWDTAHQAVAGLIQPPHRALESTLTQDVLNWCREHLGLTLGSQRRLALPPPGQGETKTGWIRRIAVASAQPQASKDHGGTGSAEE